MAIDRSMVWPQEITHAFVATEVHSPVDRSVIISNGKKVSITSPEYIRIQQCFYRNCSANNVLNQCCDEFCESGQVDEPDQPNRWLRAC